MKTFLCWLAVGCSLAGVGVSWGGDLPDPPKTYFTDQVGIIPSAAAQSLNAVLVEHARLTSEQVVVVIFKELGDHDLVEYTSSLFQSWRIGKKGKDNGLLLALYWNDHRARMEVGYGLEQLMTDARSQEILDRALIPLLREDQPESALGQTIAEILKTLDSPLVQSGQLDRWFHRGGMRQRALPTVPYAAKWIILFVFFLAVWLMRLLANLRASEHHYTRAGRLRRRGNWWGGDGFGGGGGLGGWGGFGGGGGFSGGGGRSGGGGASGSW